MRGAPPGADVRRALFVSAFVVATAGLIYELVAGALASYLLGDSVTQFSLIIGVYLSAMGVGSYASKFIERNLLARFVEIELAVALLGGFEAPALFAAFAWTDRFQWLLFGLVASIGALVGLELPLLIRILKQSESLKDLVARVFFLDYIGALVASLVFPLLLVPQLGLFRTSLAVGILNAAVALWATTLFEGARPVIWRLRGLSAAALVALSLGLAFASEAEKTLEAGLFADPVVLQVKSPYQRIAVTHGDGDTRLFLNGALQFSTVDEYRYHEALVHPAMTSVAQPRSVLVLGGGDGMAAREVLRYASVRRVVLVDLDPEVTRLFSGRDRLSHLNGEALRDPRVEVINADAFTWLVEGDDDEAFDAVIIDFPDPNNYGLGKLYTNYFYSVLKRRLAPGAAMGIQSTSPLFSPEAYWCIARTLESEGFSVKPYHAFVPAFGEWGFLLASPAPQETRRPLPEGLRFLDEATLATLFHFPPDMARRDGPINRLDNQALVRLYEKDWRKIGGR